MDFKFKIFGQEGGITVHTNAGIGVYSFNKTKLFAINFLTWAMSDYLFMIKTNCTHQQLVTR